MFLGPFLKDIKSVLNGTATSLSTYVNSSTCEHSEIAPSVFYLIKSYFDIFLHIFFLKFYKCVFFLLYQFIYKSKSIT